MEAGLSGSGRGAEHPSRTLGPLNQEMNMIWQTPQAQDFRFGFEITMYVAAR
jgi:coenzyme PQQ precursor peptide PqqA